MSGPDAQAARILDFAPRGNLTFGIFHGGVLDSHHALATGKPDSPEQVNYALDRLQGTKHLVVRTYLRFTGAPADISLASVPPVSELAQYTWNGRKLDLVLSNWDPSGNVKAWNTYIERIVERFGEYLGFLQICDEPNHYEYPGDGRFGHSVDMVISGVLTAARTIRLRSLKCDIGFNAIRSFFECDPFWQNFSAKANAQFLGALDFVGMNLYPDVAEAVTGNIAAAVEASLCDFRQNLHRANIPLVVPMHVSEHGWPTGPSRYYSRQSEVLRQVVETVQELHSALNIRQFELFSLRDADTANPDLSHQFGILRDDYTPKPAFETYRRLIQMFGA